MNRLNFRIRLTGLTILFLLMAGCSTRETDKSDVPNVSGPGITRVQEKLVEKHGEKYRERISKGTAQLAGNWRKSDGTAGDFEKFCLDNFLDDSLLAPNFQRIQKNLTIQGGYLAKIRFSITEPERFTDGVSEKVDPFFESCLPQVDFYAGKLAQFVQLNFPRYNLDEKRVNAGTRTRSDWAMIRLGDYFSDRQSSDFKAEAVDEVKEFEKNIGKYFFRMDHICAPDGSFPFPHGLTLHSHFGLRDNLKEEYTRPGGLVRQEITGKIVAHITQGTVPDAFILDTSTFWNPWTDELFKLDGGQKVKMDYSVEGNKRYAGLLAEFRNKSSRDQIYPSGSTVIKRTFENANFKPEEVETMIRTFLADPVIASVGQLIARRLGRPLQPFDIWYSGFQSQSAYPANFLDSVTRSRYPNPLALEKDLPAILVRMGFAEPEANYVGTHARVRPIESGGYSDQPVMRGDTALMTTVFNSQGLDYKGYRIAMHELGHVVCGVYTTHEVDHFLLADVPTGGITEGLAELLAYKNMEGLGLSQGSAEQQRELLALAALWYMVDLGGQSLTDIETWKWMYAHPEASADELREAVLTISGGIWNQYYSPVFGGIRDQNILSIYNHFITGSLYLFNYFIGNVVMFQLYDAFMPYNLANGLKNACREGSTLPELWMEHAAGQGITLNPLLKAARDAVAKQEVR